MSKPFRIIIDSKAMVSQVSINYSNKNEWPQSEKMLNKPLGEFFIQPDGFANFEKFVSLQITKNSFNVVVRLKKNNLPYIAQFEKIWLSESEVGYLVSVDHILSADHLPDHFIKEALNSISDAWLIIETNHAKNWSGKVKYFNQSATLVFKNLSLGQFLKEKKHFFVKRINENLEHLEIDNKLYSFSALHYEQDAAQKAIKLLIIHPN